MAMISSFDISNKWLNFDSNRRGRAAEMMGLARRFVLVEVKF